MSRPKKLFCSAIATLVILVCFTNCAHESENAPSVLATKAIEFDHAHPGLAKVLTKVSDGFGRVDYEAIKDHPTNLEDYLKLVARVPRKQFDGWSKPRRMAFLLNVYNATTLKLMADNFPVETIKEIGGFRRVWDLKVVRLFGGKISLGHLEHELIRKQFQSPSVHFALVCGSRGCPPLRKEPYTAPKLEAQFAEQAKRFLRDKKKNHLDVDKKTLYLSPVFYWFREDFGKSDAEVIALAAEHLGEAEQEALKQGGFSIKYTEFDWGANAATEK